MAMARSSVFVLRLLCLVMLAAAGRGANAKRIDTHCHLVPPFYREFLNERNHTAGGYPIPTWNASEHLALNAQFGIVTSVVSISTPGAKLEPDSPIEEGRWLARQLNEYAHNVTVQYPKRFLFFATLTLPDLEGAVAEAIYALDTLKAAGVILLASAFGEVLGTPRYAPLYQVLNERNATVFIHPSDSPCPGTNANATPSGIPPFVIDFLLDTTRAALNLVYQNVTRDYPNITFILSHSGGFLPFAAARGAGGLGLLTGQIDDVPIFLAEMAKFHVDLAVSANPFSLPSTIRFFDSSLITFGSDFPFNPPAGVLQNTNGFLDFRLPKGSRSKINFSNAFALFSKFLV